MSSSLIGSLTPWVDSSIESHIHLRSRHWPSQTSHVSSASRCTASQSSILNSVKRTVTVPRIFPTNLVESRDTGYKPVEFTANCLTMPYSTIIDLNDHTVLQCLVFWRRHHNMSSVPAS